MVSVVEAILKFLNILQTKCHQLARSPEKANGISPLQTGHHGSSHADPALIFLGKFIFCMDSQCPPPSAMLAA